MVAPVYNWGGWRSAAINGSFDRQVQRAGVHQRYGRSISKKGPTPPGPPPIEGRWPFDQNLAAFVYL
jgi:hypothetical protein